MRQLVCRCARRACCVAACSRPRRRNRRRQISGAADPHHRAVPAGRLGRRARAAARAAHAGELGPDRHRREPARRRHHDRHRSGRQGRSGRLHADHRGEQPHHQSGAAFQDAVRRASRTSSRSRCSRARRSCSIAHPSLPAKDAKELVALGKAKTAHAQLRLGRRRQHDAPDRRADQVAGRHRDAAHRLSRRHAGDERPARGPSAAAVRHRRAGAAAVQGRAVARARHLIGARATPRCRRSRPSRNRASMWSPPNGTGCSRRPARRSRSSRSSMPR